MSQIKLLFIFTMRPTSGVPSGIAFSEAGFALTGNFQYFTG